MALKKNNVFLFFKIKTMLQRIQSIYLFFASLFSGVLVLFTEFWIHQEGSVVRFIDFFNADSYVLFAIGFLFYVSSMLSFISIFLYQKRLLQLKLGRINLLINWMIIFILIYYVLNLPGGILVSVKGIGLFIPIIVVGFLLLSNRAIKKDEALVKSVDRLR